MDFLIFMGSTQENSIVGELLAYAEVNQVPIVEINTS